MQFSPNFATHFQQMFFLTFSWYSLANALVESAYGTYGKNLRLQFRSPIEFGLSISILIWPSIDNKVFWDLGLNSFPLWNLNQGDVFPYSESGDIMPEMYFGKRSDNYQDVWDSLLDSEFHALLK